MDFLNNARSSAVLGVLMLSLALAACAPTESSNGAPPIGASPAPGSFFLTPERISFEDDDRWVEAERGVLHVPLVRSKPGGNLVGIEIYRFQASVEDPGETPPIFVLHGGPGWPGLAGPLERSGYYASNIEPLRQLSDVVVVGQRGIGSSRPDTDCEPPPATSPDTELSAEERDEVVRQTSERCKAFWEGQGFDLTGCNVVEAAADVDDVRAALGYEKIILQGGSFGSHWSMAVMRFHPDIVARAVLNGLEGPDHTYDMPGDVLKGLERIAAAAEAAPELADRMPEGGLLAAYRELIAQVERQPEVITVNHPETGDPRKVSFDADDVRGMVMGYTGSARSRRGLPRWPSEMLELLAGDFSTAALEELDDDRGFPTASFFMLDCGSGISQARRERLLADPARQTVGPIGWFYFAACPVWGSDLGETFRQNFEIQVPTILVHGNWDLSTPLENALELAPFFKNGKLVIVKGGTHGALREALRESESFRDALMSFYMKGDTSAMTAEVELPAVAWELPETSES